MKTTLNAIRSNGPCSDGWAKLLKHLGKTTPDYEPLLIRTILESNGLSDALWCLRAVDGHEREMRLFAVWCARKVQHRLSDPRSVSAIDVAERFANGLATHDELRAAAHASADAAHANAANAYSAASHANAYYAAAHANAYYAAAHANASAEFLRVCQAVEGGQDPYPITK